MTIVATAFAICLMAWCIICVAIAVAMIIKG
jgi:hypothetical protein